MKNIKDLINEREVSMSHLAAKTGITRQTLYNVANSKTKPSFLIVKKICAYFNVNYKDYIKE